MPERTEVEQPYLCKEQILEDFKESIKGIKDLNCPMDNEFLQKYLAARKYRPNDALKLLKKFFELKQQNMELFRCVCPLNLREICSTQQQSLVLKHRDHLGRKILIQRNGMWNPDLLSFDQLIMIRYYILEEILCSPETQTNGVVVIFDDTGIGFDLARRCMYEMNKRFRMIIKYVQECFPGQVKGIHIVNNTYMFNILFNLMKPFLSEKMRKRFFVHGSKIQNLHKHFDPNILPIYLGGSLEAEDAVDTQLMNRLFSKGLYFKKMIESGYKDTPRN